MRAASWEKQRKEKEARYFKDAQSILDECVSRLRAGLDPPLNSCHSSPHAGRSSWALFMICKLVFVNHRIPDDTQYSGRNTAYENFVQEYAVVEDEIRKLLLQLSREQQKIFVCTTFLLVPR